MSGRSGPADKEIVPGLFSQNGRAVYTAAAAVDATGIILNTKSHKKTFQVFGTFVGTVVIDYSLDGVNFGAAESNITAPALLSNDQGFPYVRVRITAYTSGAINVLAAY